MQGGRNLISSGPLAPGTVYAGTVAADGTVGMFRVEVSVSAGTGKPRTAGGVSGLTKESIARAFSYMLAKKGDLGIGRELDTSDLHVEVIDLLNNRVEGEIGIGFFVAAISALKKAPPVAALRTLLRTSRLPAFSDSLRRVDRETNRCAVRRDFSMSMSGCGG